MRSRRPLLSAAMAVAATVAMFAGAAAAGGGPSAQAQFVAPEPEDIKHETQPDPEPQPTANHDCGDTGEHQEAVEADLDELGEYGKVFVDGDQSKEDCDAIKKFQERMGIEPADGYAGDVTADVAERIVESDLDKCEPSSGTVVCVDLTHQTLWVTDVGEIVHGPTVVRTGMSGYATTPGNWEIFDRKGKHWSRPYKVWLPDWQNFNNGQGLHQTTTYIHDAWAGSHGCVNLLPSDSGKLYDMLDYGDVVHAFGKRPGT